MLMHEKTCVIPIIEIWLSGYLHSTNGVFDTHKCSCPTSSCYVFRINHLKWNYLKVNTLWSWYICSIKQSCRFCFIGFEILHHPKQAANYEGCSRNSCTSAPPDHMIVRNLYRNCGLFMGEWFKRMERNFVQILFTLSTKLLNSRNTLAKTLYLNKLWIKSPILKVALVWTVYVRI